VILLPSAVRVYVAAEATSLRQSFEGLSNAVRNVVGKDPLSGHVFAFLNRRRTQVKLLVWTRGGYTIVHKRLERGRFSFVAQLIPGARAVELGADELAMLLEGIDARSAKKSRRWQPLSHALEHTFES
jgi:transposase